VTDNLPASVTFDSATPSQGSCSQSSGTVSCALGTLASGADATVTVKVHPQTESTITNSASVGSDAFDANSADNSASAATTVASPSYVRPRGATPIYMSLVPAYRQCTASNRTHGPSLSQPSCTPPVQSSSALTLGTPDANGSLANGGGSVRLIALINPAPAPNDVSISVNLTDVRCQTGVVACGAANATDGPDYTGELQATYSLRLTDRANDPTSTTPGTVTDTTFPVTVPCAASTSTTIGSSCSLSTSANSVAPGSVRRGDRAIWQVGRVEVDDGGPDGLIATADNSVFEVQGLFVP